MGGSTKQTTNQNQSGTSTTAIDPAIQALQVGNFNNAQGIASKLGQPYTGNLTNSYSGTPLGQATTGFQGLAGYTAPTVNTGLLSNTNLTPYESPYQNDVINSTVNQAMRAKGISDTNDAAQATQAGAFGGSRSAVLQNLDDNTWQQNLQSTLAGLNNQNFSQAQQGALADIANQNQTGEANQQASLQGAGIQGNANEALGNISSMMYGANNDNIQRAYNAWLAQQQGLLSGQSMSNAALGGIQAGQTTNGSSQSNGTSTTTQSPGIGQILGSLGSLAQGIGSQGLGFAPFASGAGSAATTAGLNSIIGSAAPTTGFSPMFGG